MKKLLRVVSVALTALMLSACFVSCGDEAIMKNMTDKEKAAYLFSKSNNYYSDGMVEEYTLSMEMTGTILDVDIESSMSGSTKTVTLDPDSDDFRYRSVVDVSSTVKMGDGKKETESYTTIEGFYDENMFLAYVPDKDSGEEPTYYSSRCSADDYKAFTDAKSGDFPEIDFDRECETVTVVKDGDSWVLTYGDLSDAATEKFGDWIADSAGALLSGLELTDFNTVVRINAKSYALESMKLEMDIETVNDPDCELEISINMEGSCYLPTDSDDFGEEVLDGYKSSGDLRYRYYAVDGLKKLLNSDDASVRLSASSTVKVSQGNISQSSKYSETDLLNYGIKDGRFVYLVDAEIDPSGSNNNYGMTIAYDGRDQVISMDGVTVQSTAQSQFEARSFIMTTLGTINFTENDVTRVSVNKKDDGTAEVSLTLRFDDKLKDSVLALGIEEDWITESKVQMLVNFDSNGNVTSADYWLTVKCYDDGIGYTIEQTSTVSDIGKADLSKIVTE